MKKITILLFILLMVMSSTSYATSIKEDIENDLFNFKSTISFPAIDYNVYNEFVRIGVNPEAQMLVKGGNMKLENGILTYTPEYKITKESYEKSKSIAKKIAPTLKAKVKYSRNHDYYTIKNVHDHVIKLMAYNLEGATNTIEDAIVRKEGKCGGYTVYTKALLDNLGIESGYALGYVNKQLHIWNTVKFNGKWYYLDTTFDDPGDWGKASDKILKYDYFLSGSVKINRERSITQLYNTGKFDLWSYVK